MIDIADLAEEDLLQHLPSILSFLTTGDDGEKHAFLVHCVQGQSRSVAAVLAFLFVSTKNLTLHKAYAHVASRRPSLCINPGFLRQLLWLEDYLHGNSNIGEYRIALFAAHRAVFRKASPSAAAACLEKLEEVVRTLEEALLDWKSQRKGREVQRTTTEEQGSDENEEEEDVEDQDHKDDDYCCRQCRQRLFTTKDLVRHRQEEAEQTLQR